MISHVAGFDCDGTGNLALNAERPPVGLLRTKVWGDARLIEIARILNTKGQERTQGAAHRRSTGINRKDLAMGHQCLRRNRLRQHIRGGRCNVQVDVVKRRVQIGKAVAAPDRGLVVPEDFIVQARCPRKAYVRTKTSLWSGNRWEGGDGIRERRVPERVRAALLLRRLIVEKVCRLAVIAPGQAQVQG